MKQDVKKQVIDVAVVVTIFTGACVVGKELMNGSWIGFNGPVLGILALGVLGWWMIRREIWRE